MAALQHGKIPQAFLFSGLTGTGKKTAAIAFAMACNCREMQRPQAKAYAGSNDAGDHGKNNYEPCGLCSSCKKIIAGTHPDIHIVKPTGSVIKVEQIRSLCRKLTLKPNEALVRLALIADAHLLNQEASNTLLKTLEEPPEHTVFILTALQASDLLPTIVSRCRHIRFNPISNQNLASLLINRYGNDVMQAEVIATMADGSFAVAMEMAESNWIKKRNWIIEQINLLPKRPIRLSLAFSEILSKNKKWLADALFILKIWYRDLVIVRFSSENVVNKDLLENIRTESSQTTVEKIIAKIRAVEEAEQRILLNTNLRTTLDGLVLILFGDNK